MFDSKLILLDKFGHGLAFIAADRTVPYLNPAARQLLGVEEAVAVLKVEDLGITYPTNFWRADLRHAEMLAQRGQHELRLLGTTFVHPEGTILLLETGVSQIEDDFRFFVMDNMGEGVLMLGKDGEVIYMNNAAHILLGVGLHAGQAQRWTVDNIGEFEPRDFWETASSKREISFHKSGSTCRLLASTYHWKDKILVCFQEERQEVMRYQQPNSLIPKDLNNLTGISPELRREAMMLANSDLSFMITGETGTGKEVMARAIHFSSNRFKGPFIVIDCTALPKDLIESELFGHEAGSFTGATREGRAGKFEQAHGGTVLLDEIAELPLPLQPKLLRVLNDKMVARIGSQKLVKADVRVIACSNRNLKELSDKETFRSDLYFRLKGAELHLPPLRARMQHFDELLELFVRIHGHGRPYVLSSPAKAVLCGYHWPGNIRELEKTVQYILSRDSTGEILPEHLPPDVMQGQTGTSNGTLKETIRLYERLVVNNALHNDQYNVKTTATALGLSQWGLRRKLRELGIRRPVLSDMRYGSNQKRVPKWLGQGNKAHIEIVSVEPIVVKPGGAVTIHVRVSNLGLNPWLEVAATRKPKSGDYTLGLIWMKLGNKFTFLPSSMGVKAAIYDDVIKNDWLPLPGIVKPGQSVEIRTTVRAPREIRAYALLFVMNHIGVGAFLETPMPSVKYVHEVGSSAIIEVRQEKD
jgi:transcriptional regulator with PAS, ATPase and Fis domain